MSRDRVQVIGSSNFIYEPPQSALTAKRILVKPNLGYPVPPPVTVSLKVLATVLTTLRQKNPQAEIFIVEGVCSPVSLSEIIRRLGIDQILGEGIEVFDADTLPLTEYPNFSPQPVRFKSMFAPRLLMEVDCRISVAAFKRTTLKGEPLISASLKNLYGLFPRKHYHARSLSSRGQLHRPSVPLILQDVYFCIGHLFDGAVVDGDRQFISLDWKPDRGKSISLEKVFWGEDLIGVDREACRVAGEMIPSYLERIDQLRQITLTQNEE
ncbi:hypothetical protein PCC9214_03973 [Planktothrix tepida]|uniref:DUF362 domain-containing protein n=2 Tax=Planktothrix TaxID=54304 RepID=A0A1J1LNI8_9CYAN|nr:MULTISPECIES: DUF362 domain-containing protein [Planktothrix]CAD5937031.1 hypothetical protein NO713_01666 [Planktothrix pseudagardhii]CAD5973348.1 hypothetical protein PCC9214_03973 [Planktothrix tepida]CUR33983.1 conserved hypothetical protein [Planktothrix tepida PCC 9214]